MCRNIGNNLEDIGLENIKIYCTCKIFKAQLEENSSDIENIHGLHQLYPVLETGP